MTTDEFGSSDQGVLVCSRQHLQNRKGSREYPSEYLTQRASLASSLLVTLDDFLERLYRSRTQGLSEKADAGQSLVTVFYTLCMISCYSRQWQDIWPESTHTSVKGAKNAVVNSTTLKA